MTGVKACAHWKDGTTSWELMVDIKQSYPLELAEYAVAQGINEIPAFAWWVPYVLRKRKRILAASTTCGHTSLHHGFKIPKMVRRAHEIDDANGNTLWRDAIAKEMADVRVAFKILLDGSREPVGYQYMECHQVFEIKLDGFRRKA